MPYLARLAVSHLYCSPYLQARAGSRDGYDVVDHQSLNQDLGGEAAHARLCSALREHGLGQVLDHVPNHMAVNDRRNRWWWDVLENGRSSRYAAYFDLFWDAPERMLRGRILLPVLGDHYARALESGQLRLVRRGSRVNVAYFEQEFPLDPRTYALVLPEVLTGLGAELAALPDVRPGDQDGASCRHRLASALLGQLEQPDLALLVDQRLAQLNAEAEAVDALLGRQHYRLARWQVAAQELTYRRFFDVSELAAIRVEDPEVFEQTHRLVIDWVNAGVLDGLRIDHPDGLRDPKGYFQKLAAEAPSAWLVAEKILGRSEQLPEDWPVAGTTGYDFLNLALGLVIDPQGEPGLSEAFQQFTGLREPYAEVVYSRKRQVMEQLLGSDLNNLLLHFERVRETDRRYRDYTSRELRDCLTELIACLPVYRTYVRPQTEEPPSLADGAVIEAAVAAVRQRRPELAPELLGFLGRLILKEETLSEEAVELIARFQQTSSPVTAKGVEDTSFYVYNRLVALNEVGGDPGWFGVSPAAFHAACVHRAERWPAAMLSTSTHDTKRSEDVRARLALLSELPLIWSAATARWSELNERQLSPDGPDRSAEYLLYQTLVGAWPLGPDRAVEYMVKAAREAKTETSWIANNHGYEAALERFVRGVLADPEFLAELEDFVQPLIVPGRINSLAQKLLCLTAPGVPDCYQGCELWDLSLVDPDNRRPVDFAKRARLLDELDAMGDGAASVWHEREDSGLAKLLVVTRALRLRERQPDIFAAGYEPVAVEGPKADHAIAFKRGDGAVTVIPRLVWGLAGDWGTATAAALPKGCWRDLFSGAKHAGGLVALKELLGAFPVALLERIG